MLDKELEILKLIEELYHGDTTDGEMLDFADKNQVKVQAWREAFEEYPLFEITKAINHFYVKKNSKSRPNIKQILAILEETDAEKIEPEVKVEKVEACYGIRYQQQDKEDGNMHWFVPDYIEVEELIRRGKYGFVHNYNHPTHEEFTRCMEYWCYDNTGHKYRFYSDNDIRAMTPEQQDALWEKCHKMADGFLAKCNIKIN